MSTLKHGMEKAKIEMRAILQVARSQKREEERRHKRHKEAITVLGRRVHAERRNLIQTIAAYKGPKINLLPWDYLGPLRGSYRERAHTMLLGYLLDPRYAGLSAKKLLYHLLKKCRYAIRDRKGVTALHRLLAGWRASRIEDVAVEAGIGDPSSKERPDITIRIRHNDGQIFVVIENKIWAEETKEQTARYYRSLTKGSVKERMCKNCIEKNRKSETPKARCRSDHVGILLSFTGRRAKCAQFVSLGYAGLHQILKDVFGKTTGLHRKTTLERIAEDYARSLETMFSKQGFVAWECLGELVHAKRWRAFTLAQLRLLAGQARKLQSIHEEE